MSILVILKREDSKYPPDEVMAQIEEHMPEGVGLAVLLDLSRLDENLVGARGYGIVDGKVVSRPSVAVVKENLRHES